MAGKKRTTTRTPRKVVAKRKSVNSRPSKASVSIADSFRFGESYTSLVLGIIVVIVATILLVAFVRGKQTASNATQDTSSLSTQEETLELPEKTYTVKAGDDLWKIAQEQYQDGFMWTKIAQANNITDPGVIEVGTKLTLPLAQSEEQVSDQTNSNTTDETLVEESAPQTSSNAKITGDSYTVVRGDDLWDIAVRAYGDGYRWVDIARANNLTNPDVIHADNKLIIPRG